MPDDKALTDYHRPASPDARAVWAMMQRRLERSIRRKRIEDDLAAYAAAAEASIAKIDDTDDQELSFLRPQILLMSEAEGRKRLPFVLRGGAYGKIVITKRKPRIVVVDGEVAVADLSHPSGAVKIGKNKLDLRKANEWFEQTGEILPGCNVETPTEESITVTFGGANASCSDDEAEIEET